MFKILLIEDDEADRKVITAALAETKLNAHIVEVGTAEEGFKLFEEKGFDCILLEYRLPGKNGLEMLRELFETHWEGPPSVIMVTSVNDDDLAVQCLRAGAQDFILKETITPAFLTRSIINAIERKTLNDQRHRMEEKLWENQKIEAVNKATNKVAQEFETLWLSLGLALKPLGYENLSKTGTKSLIVAMDLVARGTKLVDGLVNLADDMEQIDRPEEVNYLVNDTKLILQSVLGEYKTLEFKPTPRRRSIRVHKGLFKNAMVNLVKNAAEAMSAGGICTIKIKEITVVEGSKPPVEGMPVGHYIAFAVSDTGTGMSEEVLRQALEARFTTKKGRNALGVGLSQVAYFVKKSEGFMKLESTAGEGTEVHMYFPLLKES